MTDERCEHPRIRRLQPEPEFAPHIVLAFTWACETCGERFDDFMKKLYGERVMP